jgi:[ribosomal protein S5]-alanine N-acetyltransferase
MGRTVPVLTTPDGLTLRPWRDDGHDVDVVLQAAADPQIRHYSPTIALVDGPETALQWLGDRSAEDRMEWVVEDDAAVVGRTSLHLDDHDATAELGYWLLPEARGQGTATRAVRAVMAWALGEGEFGRLEIEHELENVASCRVAQRCGFALEGTKRGGILIRGGRADVHLHGLLASDLVR